MCEFVQDISWLSKKIKKSENSKVEVRNDLVFGIILPINLKILAIIEN